jgi:hypothetical protein
MTIREWFAGWLATPLCLNNRCYGRLFLLLQRMSVQKSSIVFGLATGRVSDFFIAFLAFVFIAKRDILGKVSKKRPSEEK